MSHKIYMIFVLVFFVGCGGGGNSPKIEEINSTIVDESNNSIIVDNNSSLTDERNNSITLEEDIISIDNNNSIEQNETVVTNTVPPILGKAQLGVLSEATIKLYELDDGIKKLLATDITSKGNSIESIGNFNLHLEMIESDKFYVYEVSSGYDYDTDDNGIIESPKPAHNKQCSSCNYN